MEMWLRRQRLHDPSLYFCLQVCLFNAANYRDFCLISVHLGRFQQLHVFRIECLIALQHSIRDQVYAAKFHANSSLGMSDVNAVFPNVFSEITRGGNIIIGPNPDATSTYGHSRFLFEVRTLPTRKQLSSLPTFMYLVR